MHLVEQLQELLRGEVLSDQSSREYYSQDASIFQVFPEVIVRPADLQDLQKLVQFVAEQKQSGRDISLTPRNKGTCMSGGSLTESVMVDLSSNFTHIGEISTKKTIDVGAGTMFKDIAAEADKQDLMFAAYTSSKDICGIGGMLGNNASGEKSIRFGATTDNTNVVHAVLADGNEYSFGPLTKKQLEHKMAQQDYEGYVYRSVHDVLVQNRELIERSRPNTRKNAAGLDVWRVWDENHTHFNLAHLLIGAQGTLGVITGAQLQLVPQPKHTQMIVIGISNLLSLADALKTVLANHAEAVEVYDVHTYELAELYMPEVAQAAKSAKGKQMVLLAQFSENTQARTEHTAKIVVKELQKKEIAVDYITDPVEQDAHWQIRRASFKLLKEHAHGKMRATPFLEDTIVSTTHFGEFAAALQAILDDYDLTYTYHGHIGDGSLRLVPLIDVEDDGAVHLIAELSKRIFDLVSAFDGSISVDHNDGLAKSPYLEAMYGPDMMNVFRSIKHIFDPHGIFNPNKKSDASLEYSQAHIARDNNAGLI